MRILITGAHGQLGSALQQVLSQDELILKDLPQFDLSNPACEEQILSERPDAILHVGAYTNVDGAEREPERARLVNVQGTKYVARAAERLGARLLFVSTDYVFDGKKTSPYTEEDLPSPINQYGLSKYQGELAVLAECSNSLIVRTAWLYGIAGQNFVKTIMRIATEKPVLDVVGDQRGCPTNAEDLARAIGELIRGDARGICHATNSGNCTWHEFAEAIVKEMGLSVVVRPISTAQAARLARRPAYSVLSHDRLNSLYQRLPNWREALARFIKLVDKQAPAVG
ncbi:dTDP-4-dehydrorhamnose reductase [Petrachloros mirabilis]